MLIDWFTVGAQTLNFLILVWLLQRFLYKPILRAIDAREKRIAWALTEADGKMAEAQKERAAFQRKSEELDGQRAALVRQMTADVEAERLRLLDEARLEADALRAKRMELLRNDAQTLRQAISRRTQQEVFAITRKTLSDLASASLEERMVEVFVRQLHALNEQDMEGLKSAFKTASGTATVRSAFDLPAAQRAALENVIKELFAVEAPLRFETAPNLVSGLDLTANGQKITWNIAAYLMALEKGIGELLEVKHGPEAMKRQKTKEVG